MAQDLSRIDTVVIVLMENRSFDHMLGYLRLPPTGWNDVEGLQDDAAWLAQFANYYEGNAYKPFPLSETYVPEDPPHERDNIALQLGSTLSNTYPMNGFAKNYSFVMDFDPTRPPVVMGYHSAAQVPTMDFFASHYAICDHWFSAIPTGTQPNRFMAMAGVTPIDTNKGVLAFPDQDTVYDWLNKRGIRWRVYSGGLPFFFLMDKWRGKMLTDDEHFRNVANLARDVQEEDDSSYPQVIFVEPCYTDDPFHGPKNDDHPTTPIDRGQEFLADTYRALASSPKRWKRTVVILTYDEHGGFFDHVSPLPVITNAPNGEYAPFTSTGPRVPAFVLSPLVAPRTVYKDPLDHTAILRFLGEKFDNGSYSKDVDARSISGRISSLLKLTTPRNDVPMPHPPSGILPRMSINSEAFLAAGKAARANATAKARRRFPGLWSV